jgi:5'-3' exonuclease
MGIKQFHSYIKKRFSNHMYKLYRDKSISSINNLQIDNFLIDGNALMHSSMQKIFQYGSGKPMLSFLNKKKYKPPTFDSKNSLLAFQDVCSNIDNLVNSIRPRKRLLIAIDGPAPLAKLKQQRSRRFMSSVERNKLTDNENTNIFDSNSLSVGTKFMDDLTKYIEWYIKKRMSEQTKNSFDWSKIEIVYSDEKVKGEGEHKLLNFIRKFGNKEETYCIHSGDSDLVMLSLICPNKIYVYKEESMSPSYDTIIDIESIRNELSECMKWEDAKPFNAENSIIDFVFIFYFCGNDFLPNSPCIEILEGGVEFMLDTYRSVCSSYGHITKKTKDNKSTFRKKSLEVFLGTLSQYEKGVLQNKLDHKGEYFENTLLEKNSKVVNGKNVVNMKAYRKDYYANKVGIEPEEKEKMVHNYIDGLIWILGYYTGTNKNWRWKYPYNYAPFCHTLARFVSTYKFKEEEVNSPSPPFLQLLCVLPPASSNLLPSPLNTLLFEDSPLKEYYPKEFKIDLEGKRNSWEGVALLPELEIEDVEKEYTRLATKVAEKEKERNIVGKSYVFRRGTSPYPLKSVYGNFTCYVESKEINLA